MPRTQEPLETQPALDEGGTGNAAAARDRCGRLLQRALDGLGSSDGAVFSIGPDQSLDLVARRGDRGLWGETGYLYEAARGVQRSGLPAMPARRRGPDWFRQDGEEPYAGLPLRLDGTLIGVLMAANLPIREPSAASLTERVGDLPELVALALEHFRTLSALDHRGDEVSALRRQLDAYALDFRSTYQAERDRAHQLAETLGELEKTYRATVAGLAMAVEAKDECTGGHLYRVSRYGMLVTALAAPEQAENPQFEYGFLLHDVGKLMVPDAVLNKPGPLNEDEWEIIKAHPAKGRSILEGIDFLSEARDIVYSHHERWDGQGYPRGLEGQEIPLGARIFPLCDAFDAMTTNRPYRTAMPIETALEEIRAGSGTQFWPEAVEAFMAIPVDVLEPIRRERVRRPS